MMDHVQLNYFITIVDSGCNLSLAGKKLHISQSALSQLIINFESEENLLLFHRKNGRLESLTSSGKKLYEYAQIICKEYAEMEKMLIRESYRQKGKIKIGIPSLILEMLLPNFLPEFMIKNPELNILIIEKGSLQLQKMLINDEIDYAFLVDPTNLSQDDYEQHIVQINEIVAFMSNEHALANKNELSWVDLENSVIATFDRDFSTNKLINNRLKKYNVENNIIFTSISWRYLLETVCNKNVVALLPALIEINFISEKICKKNFSDFIPFNVMFCKKKDNKNNLTKDVVYSSILNYFYQLI
jgi:DNA-binding transcriptional LysR family regulator